MYISLFNSRNAVSKVHPEANSARRSHLGFLALLNTDIRDASSAIKRRASRQINKFQIVMEKELAIAAPTPPPTKIKAGATKTNAPMDTIDARVTYDW